MNHSGELWEHGELQYYVLESYGRNGGWLAMRLGYIHPDEPRFTILANEFFNQEWWERIA